MMLPAYLFWYIFNILLPGGRVESNPKERLSEYGFFEGRLADLKPAPGVVFYRVNTPLFSNYSEKLRFIKLPPGGKMSYRDSGAFEFPKGTVLIKNFYYPADFRNEDKGRVILETRLLVHADEGWQAYPYIWDEKQSEAFYDPAGETRQVKYTNKSGKKITTTYVIPNKNQCKGCHLNGKALIPLGLSARQLNSGGDHASNVLIRWQEEGILEGVPPLKSVPAGIVWDNTASGTLNDRARAYLDANCAHCHSKNGSANTSGLFLDVYEKNLTHLGVFKSPVAAGRGAGDMKFDIVPGAPDKSILVYRMSTNDPAIAMPEIGREQVHREGLALIEEWIRSNRFSETQYDPRGK